MSKISKTVRIMSVRFTLDQTKSLLKKIDKRISNGEKTVIFTPNPKMLLEARKDPQLKKLLTASDINIPDGVGIVMASKMLKNPLPERIAGIDFGEQILRLAEIKGHSVFFLGGRPGVAKRAALALKKKYPSLKVCGTHHGYFEKSGIESTRIAKRISACHPDILFVCLGFPLQEKWIINNAHLIPSIKLAIGLGGSLDVWSGDIRRAPDIFRKTGTEWLWRAIREPRRLGILLDIPKFLFFVAVMTTSRAGGLR